MGDGPQQIGPELFLLCLELGLLLFTGVAHIFQRQGALAQHGLKHAVFKGLQRLSVLHDHTAVDPGGGLDEIGRLPFTGADRQLPAQQLAQLILGHPEDFLL